MARQIHANLRGSELLIIPSAAHLSNVEQPAVFNKAIRTRLLKEISISSGSPVSGMVNADDVEIYARNQSGLASGQMEWIRLARGIHREVEERKHEWSGQDMDELPQRAIYREWARRMK